MSDYDTIYAYRVQNVEYQETFTSRNGEYQETFTSRNGEYQETFTSRDGDYQETVTARNVLTTSQILVTIVGTLLNVWFLVAILTSRDMRSRLRNKIICNTFIVHLFDSVIIIPMILGQGQLSWQHGCGYISALNNLLLIQDFIGNWLIVMLLVVCIAQMVDFNPRTRLTPRTVTLGTLGLIVSPWFAALILVPSIVYKYEESGLWIPDYCFLPTYDAYLVFKSIDTAAPMVLSILILIVAAVLRYKRFTQTFPSNSMQAEVINPSPQIDNIFAYVFVVIGLIVCDLFRMIFYLNQSLFDEYNLLTRVSLSNLVVMMSDARLILMPLAWLLLPDVRQRIRTWRPWSRPAPVVDLTVTYRQDENV